MFLDRVRSRAIDLKVTEDYLMSLPDVLDASAWWSDDGISAHVTVHDRCNSTPEVIQRACVETIGEDYSPQEVLFFRARRQAA